jgi:hypothetical protein
LRNDEPKRLAKAVSDRVLIAQGEGADDAFNRFRRVGRVERGENQVTCFGGFEGDFHRLSVAHLSHQYYLRGLPYRFMQDLAKRLAHRVQLTTDGHRAYLSAVESNFGSEIDYAMLVKLYGSDAEADTRYSPAECIGCREVVVSGSPDPQHISTSFIERQNLTMRMGMRRFTRLTNGFSKKLDNHIASIAIHYMHYNFCRIHQTLRVTPAMEAGVADHVWTIPEVVSLLDAESKREAA